MIIDMPLPMPRWLISSPIHISSGRAGDERRDDEVARGATSRRAAAARWAPGGAEKNAVPRPGAEDEHQAGRLQRGQRDGDVAGVLGDLALADRTLLLQLLQLRDHHAEDLHDDARRDVRHDPEREDREALERAAGEQVEEARARPVFGRVLELLDGERGRCPAPGSRRRTGTRRSSEREQDLVAQIRDLEDVLQVGEHVVEPCLSVAGRRGAAPSTLSGWRTGCP